MPFESGEVSPLALSGAWRDTPSETQKQPHPEQSPAWPDAGQRSGSDQRGAKRRAHLHRQESSAYRRDSGRGQGAHDVPALDERDIILTRPEAATYLRKSVATIDRWASLGIVKPVRLGPRAIAYRLADLRRFIGAETGEAA